jgi:hypothetical protein
VSNLTSNPHHTNKPLESWSLALENAGDTFLQLRIENSNGHGANVDFDSKFWSDDTRIFLEINMRDGENASFGR